MHLELPVVLVTISAYPHLQSDAPVKVPDNAAFVPAEQPVRAGNALRENQKQSKAGHKASTSENKRAHASTREHRKRTSNLFRNLL